MIPWDSVDSVGFHRIPFDSMPWDSVDSVDSMGFHWIPIDSVGFRWILWDSVGFCVIPPILVDSEGRFTGPREDAGELQMMRADTPTTRTLIAVTERTPRA